MRVGPAVLLTAALLAAACGGSDRPRVAATTTTAAPAGGPITTPSTAAEPGSPTSRPRGASTTATAASPTSTTAPAPAGPSPLGPAGSFAPAYLGRHSAARLTVELLAEPGLAPDPRTVDHLVSVLRRVAPKPVDVVGPETIAGGDREWTGDDLRALADRVATVPQATDRAVMRLLFVHGTWAASRGDAEVLGISVRGDLSAVFADEVRSAAGPFGDRALEDAVVTHEAGHLLGLVDLYLHTGRQDPDHPGHSTNPRSVMYWAVESSLVGDILTGGPPRDFDAADLADLERISES